MFRQDRNNFGTSLLEQMLECLSKYVSNFQDILQNSFETNDGLKNEILSYQRDTLIIIICCNSFIAHDLELKSKLILIFFRDNKT